MAQQQIIGFDRKIKLEWLEIVVELISQGISISELRQQLDSILANEISVNMKDAAMKKTITVLTRIWCNVPEHLVLLRNEGLCIVKHTPSQERKLIHLGMAMANYRFCFDVMSQVGRLAKLQEELSSAQIKRRMKETWGSTERVTRSTRHVLQNLRLWGFLRETGKKGNYSLCKPVKTSSKKLEVWLVKAFLHAFGKPVSYETVSNHPALFFTELNLDMDSFSREACLEVTNQGLDTYMVSLTI